MNRPFFRESALRNGLFYLWAAAVALNCPPHLGTALAEDGATEALGLRYEAEMAIAQERRQGRPQLADAMQQALPDLLQEYLITRDGTIAMDAVDTAFVQEQFKVARAMEEPGVALALDVFSGPGTGFENELRSGIAGLAEFHADEAASRVSEKALDAHERIMERQLEKVERHMVEMQALSDKLDATFDARSAATLDKSPLLDPDESRTEEQIAAKIDQIVAKTEVKVETVVEKVEVRVEAVVEKAVEKVESNPEKAQSVVEKAESKIDQIVEKADNKIDNIVSNAQSQIDNLSGDSTPAPEPAPEEGGKGGKKK